MVILTLALAGALLVWINSIPEYGTGASYYFGTRRGYVKRADVRTEGN